jgi:hypothetical protein
MSFSKHVKGRPIEPPICPIGKGKKDNGHIFDIQKGPFRVERNPGKGPGSQSFTALTLFAPLYSNHPAYMVCKCGISEPYFRGRT